ncbi:hypothetical protein Q8F55_007602 [Vanrija albida]|uniref:RRM domain-containing protein n=1 Tax=Vanrija albida TaxID=181172 RepID=A0ABR3PUW9_9TREE
MPTPHRYAQYPVPPHLDQRVTRDRGYPSSAQRPRPSTARRYAAPDPSPASTLRAVDDATTLAGYSDATAGYGDATPTAGDETAASAALSDAMDVDEDVGPRYWSHYSLPALELPELPDVPRAAGRAPAPRAPDYRVPARVTPRWPAPRPQPSLFERAGVPLAARLGPAHRRRKYKNKRKRKPGTRAQADAPARQSHSVRIGPVGMPAAAFIELLRARVGPIAAHSWAGAHVTARFVDHGDAQRAVGLFHYVELEKGTLTKAVIV